MWFYRVAARTLDSVSGDQSSNVVASFLEFYFIFKLLKIIFTTIRGMIQTNTEQCG